MKSKSLLFLAGSVIFAGTARAALFYSGLQNVAIPQTLEGEYLRISDGTTWGTYPASWSTEPWLNPFFGGLYVANSPLLRPVITGTDQIVNLAAGTVIDSASNFVSGESGSSTHMGPAGNQFQIGTPGIVGLEFKASTGSPQLYGWVRMTISNTGPGSILDWAYESTPGTSIMAGQIAPVPEPAAGAIGLLCLGVGCVRRRRGSRG